METIKGKCKTSLDNYDVSLVKSFARVPNIGERVTCTYKGNPTDLKICQITHSVMPKEHSMYDKEVSTPFIIVELHN